VWPVRSVNRPFELGSQDSEEEPPARSPWRRTSRRSSGGLASPTVNQHSKVSVAAIHLPKLHCMTLCPLSRQGLNLASISQMKPCSGLRNLSVVPRPGGDGLSFP
jgi:hypothetical protein